MVWKKGCVTRILGILFFGLVSGAQIPSMAIAAQARINESVEHSVAECTEQRGQILERLVRELIYRSHSYVNTGQFDRAAHVLGQAASMVAVLEDPFAKTDVVANLAGISGGQPSSMEQIVGHGIEVKQSEQALLLLRQIADATHTLEGEYGVVNSQRAILVQLGHYYNQLNQPNQARLHFEQARSLLGFLRGDGFGLISAPVAEGYLSLGDRQTAIAILDEAWQHTQTMTTQNLEYLASILRTIATTYAKAGATPQALEIAKQIPVPGVKALTLATIAQDLATPVSGAPVPWEAIERLLSQVGDMAPSLPEPARAQVRGRLAVVYAHLGQWQRATQWVDAIAIPETKIQTLAELAAIEANPPERSNRLLNRLVKTAQTIEPFYKSDTQLRQTATRYLANHQFRLALQLVTQLDATLRSELLLSLIQAASNAGDFASAQQALEALEPGWENQSRSLGLRAIALGYLRTGQVDQAIQRLPQITDSRDYPSQVLTRLAIAQFYGQNGQLAQALEQLNQAQESLAKLEDASAKLEALGKIALQFEQLGQSEQARVIQSQAIKIAQTLHPSDGIESLVRQYLAENDALALQLIQSLVPSANRDRFLQIAVQQLLETGKIPAAVQASVDMQDPYQRAAIGVAISDYFRALGQQQAAADYLAHSLAIAQALPGPDEVSFANAAQRDPSLPQRDPFDRGTLLAAIAVRYAEMGQLKAAQKAVQALQHPRDQQHLQQRLKCYEPTNSKS